MKNKCKVVALPTESVTSLAYSGVHHTFFEPLHLPVGKKDDYIYLYLVSEEEIKEGDYVYHHNGINTSNKIFVVDSETCLYNVNNWGDKKVIATTDEQLGLPIIPEQFVKEYCEKGGIDEVMCEVKVDYDVVCEIKPEECRLYNKGRGDCEECEKAVKKVFISPVKETWTREELPIDAIKQVLKYCESKEIYDKLGRYGDFYYKLNEWINNNL